MSREGTLRGLATLLDQLSDQGIRYCSWKSNEHLDAALAGRTDLDLLVEAGDAQRFRELVGRSGGLTLVPAPDRAFPGMEHHLGFDEGSGRLYHLHVHTQLVLGEQHVKNHHVPLESAFLDSTRELDGVRVPAPELELAVLAVRALLKYRARDIVKDVLEIRSPGLKEPLRRELRWLLDRTNVEAVRAALHDDGGDVLPADLVCGFLDAFERDPRSGRTFARLRSRLRRETGHLRRRGRLTARLGYVRTMWHGRRHLRIRPYEARMSPAGGGRTIALVGADGSGKSTLTAELERWLGWKLRVRTYYLGSKSPSAPSRGSYVAFRAFRRAHRSVTGGRGEDSVVARSIRWARDAALAMHHLAIARDRSRRCREGLRDARAGRVVMFDRMPLFALSDRPEHLVLDGPRIRRTLDVRAGWLMPRLAAAEERRYRGLSLPDHLVFLDVSPEVASSRKPDHDPEVLTAKCRAAAELATLAELDGSADVTRIDADRPLDDVLLDLRANVWAAL